MAGHDRECREPTPSEQEKTSSREARLHATLPGMEDTPILAETDFQKDSGLRLRRLIHKLGITQVKAAELMGISKHVLRNWLVGEHPIKPFAVYRLCKARGIDFNYVFLGDWAQLPYKLAREFEQELTSKLAASSEVDRREPEKSES